MSSEEGAVVCGIYARKSTEQSGVADDLRSVARQVAGARAFAAEKGWTVAEVHVYSDDGVSGAEFDRRPAFLRLMDAVSRRPRPFDVLVMSEESRLGREIIETSYALKKIVSAGIRVFFLDGRERTLDSPTEKLLLSVTAFADELERERARQRTYDALLHRAKAGHVTGGRTFGYDNVPATVAGGDGVARRQYVERRINEEEAAVVRQIFELTVAGHGLTRIAKALNQQGACSPRSQQGRPRGWAPSSVREVLHRDLYRGVVVWNKTRKRDRWGVKGQRPREPREWIRADAPHLRIVSDELWETAKAQARAAVDRFGRVRGGRPSATGTKYLLAGLLTCATCGGSLEVRSRINGHGRVRFIGCSTYHRRGQSVCPNSLTVPMEQAEMEVLESLQASLLEPRIWSRALDYAVATLTGVDPRSAIDRLEGDVQRVDTELARLAGAVAHGGDLPPLLPCNASTTG